MTYTTDCKMKYALMWLCFMNYWKDECTTAMYVKPSTL